MKQRLRLVLPLALLFLGMTRGVSADVQIGPLTASGEIELGYQGNRLDESSAKFEEYRDTSPGLVSRGELLIEDEEGSHYLRGWFENATRRDQEYNLLGGRYGRYRIELGFDQFPYVYSNQALSPYGDVSQGGDATLSLPPGFARPPPDLAAALGTFATSTDLELRRRNAHAAVALRLSEDVQMRAGYVLRDKVGTRKLGVAFGSPGSQFAEVARPVDDRTHEVTGGAEVALGGWSVDLAYTGSFFQNEFRSITVDNPRQAADVAGASSRARLAEAPDNSMHQGSLSLAKPLTLGFPSRVAATLAYGVRRQDDRFLPHTVNSALASPVLPQSSLDGEVQTLLANFLFTARPAARLNLEARYRLYDYNNDTGSITFNGRVSNDRSVTAGTFTSNPNEYRTQNASLEASYRIGERSRLTMEYEWENWHRNRVREVSHLNEHKVTLKADAAPEPWVRLRATTAIGWRDGNDYETNEGEPAALRRFDQADRRRYEADLRATLVPREDLSASLTAGYGYDDYDDTEWGLTDARRWGVGTDASYQPWESVSFSGYYAYENIEERLKSVFATSWRNHDRNRAHNVGLAMMIALIPERLDAEVSWDYQWGRASTDTKGAAGIAVDFPSITDNLQVFATTFTYRVSEELKVRWGYRFERFRGSDFRTDDLPLNATANDIYLSDEVEDYKAHVFSGSVVFSF